MRNAFALFWLIAFFVVPANGQAPPLIQQVEPASSTAKIALESSWLNFTGDFRRYSGEIELEPQTLRPRKASFVLDLGSLALSFPDGRAVELRALLPRLPLTPGRFTSTAIIQQGSGRYLIKGFFSQGQTKRPFEVQVREVSSSSARSVYELSRQGTVEELDPVFRPVLVPPDAIIRFHAKLTFNRSLGSARLRPRGLPPAEFRLLQN